MNHPIVALPFVSVIVPVKDEELFIRESLLSLLFQDYDRDGFEILVVDDHSTDRTRAIAETMAENDRRIRVLDNRGNGTPSARNSALSQSKGSIIVNFSGHAIASKLFLATVVTKLVGANANVVGVGCRHEMPTDEPLFARLARLALSTYLGGIGSTYHQHDSERFLLSIAFTAYRREAFDLVGYFDESIKPTGEDLEFNLRLNEAGYRLLYTPTTAVYHRGIRSITRFIHHVFLYGLARGVVTLKHPRFFSLIHIVPSLLVLMFATSLFSFTLSGRMPEFFVAIWLAYLMSCLGSALAAAGSVRMRLVGVLTAIFPIVHFSYGMGYLATLPLSRSYLRAFAGMPGSQRVSTAHS